jgi:hypothetical protein
MCRVVLFSENEKRKRYKVCGCTSYNEHKHRMHMCYSRSIGAEV